MRQKLQCRRVERARFGTLARQPERDHRAYRRVAASCDLSINGPTPHSIKRAPDLERSLAQSRVLEVPLGPTQLRAQDTVTTIDLCAGDHPAYHIRFVHQGRPEDRCVT